jgi:hypothetical protein
MQLADHQLLEVRALEVWLEHPVTKTYLACLDLYYKDLVNDIDSAIEQVLANPNEAFIKTVVHKTGQQFAVKHTGEFADFIESFGGLIPPKEDKNGDH